MGATLRRTAYSPNIKERRDYSCAIFDLGGRMVGAGRHMPVHLGSMPLSVAAAIENRKLGPGDMVVLNDPFKGGTHLPTSRWFRVCSEKAAPFLCGVRAHHSDVGGMSSGIHAAGRRDLSGRPPHSAYKLLSRGEINRDVWN